MEYYQSNRAPLPLFTERLSLLCLAFLFSFVPGLATAAQVGAPNVESDPQLAASFVPNADFVDEASGPR